MRLLATLPFAFLALSSPAWAGTSTFTQPPGGARSGSVMRAENYPQADVPEYLRVNVAFDAKDKLYCVTRKYRSGTPIPAPACRTATAWNQSGDLGIELPSAP